MFGIAVLYFYCSVCRRKKCKKGEMFDETVKFRTTILLEQLRWVTLVLPQTFILHTF